MFAINAPLSSGAAMSRRDDVLKVILEPKIPGVHYHVNEGSCDGAPAGEPRVANGARGHNIVPAGFPTLQEVCTTVEGAEGDPSAREEEYIAADVISSGCHSWYLEYLQKNGPNFMTESMDAAERNCSVLLKLADDLQVLPPANDSLPWEFSLMSQWKASLCKLVEEMKTVEERCALQLRNSGVYVLTISPYDEFLRALAKEIKTRSL